VSAPVLTRRALNRALLARQLLLERVSMPALDAVEHLVGMQAQEPQAPYLGLWSRLQDFDPCALSDLLESRQVVRASLMRWTIHLVSASDYARLWPLMREVAARGFRGSAFSKQLGGAAPEEVVAHAHEFLSDRPHSRAELAPRLAERWPEADPPSLAMAATVLAPVVHVPPRGLWGQGGQTRFAPAAAWLGRELDGASDPDAMVLRYLAAFGPASVRDIQAWSGLTRLGSVIARLDLVKFCNEEGTELLDVPGGVLPSPEVAAPVRILPPFDNVILGHADRTRVISDEDRARVNRDRLMRTFLVDGFVAGAWQVKDGTLSLEPFRPLTRLQRSELLDEAAFFAESLPTLGSNPAKIRIA
jgi:hypothetical protein